MGLVVVGDEVVVDCFYVVLFGLVDWYCVEDVECGCEDFGVDVFVWVLYVVVCVGEI